ncbi:IS66 family transposase [Defluviicoccus vanus]|uniref:IS66 family transposase n=1 Tax=Defluviicoccus vanus TaxID=111831 RepID=A0A7H1MX90_9PROT|nr:IS66 family transposase [Defluviicoccus vanus]QNT68076.1 IS66 family transposase [Defluviicoccus vanus]
MTPSPDILPDDLEALKAALLAERSARLEAEARASGAEAMVAHLKLMIAKLKRERFGPSSEHRRRLLDQLELQLEELEATAAEDACAAEAAAAAVAKPRRDESVVPGTGRRRPVRAPLPAHLPRERVVIPAPSVCPCCQGKLVKLGEDVTETLEVIPRQWKVIQTVREKFTCRACERITQPPAPFHPIARGRAGAGLLAMVLYGKYGLHLPLNRQSEGFAREGIDLDVSTLADWVGACAVALSPLVELLRRHVLAAGRLHGDDTTVPVLAKGKTITGRLWTYVRDDRPFGGPHLDGTGPPAAVYFYSRNREGEHPRRHLTDYAGILQADAFGGFNALYEPSRKPGPITEAACWSHGRRKFFALADVAKAPLAIEAVRRIDAVFDAERPLNGLPVEQRLALRQCRVAPLVGELEAWMRRERGRLSRHNELAKAMDYMLKRWPAFTRFLEDGRICLTNNAAERALRGIALGRRSWLFAGSDRGGERAAAIYTLIGTAKLNDVDPQAWLEDVLRRIADHPASRLAELLPWNWRPQALDAAAA